MSARSTRRSFLSRSLTAGALFSFGDLGFLAGLPAVSADDAKGTPGGVSLRDEIAPLVKLIETTPRNRLLEEVAQRIRKGLGYRELLAALQLASVINVEPRPSVGFKFHAVLAVNSCHLASLSSPPEHRWLPIFWALDNYKSSEARDVEERGDWRMGAVDEAAVPHAHNALSAFEDAMANWDVAAADAAVAGLSRTAGANEVYESMFRLGARDFRSIGHKAIFVANSFRTLQCIGWEHAEPILRSLAYAMTMYDGGNPATSDHEADRPYRINSRRIQEIRPEWRGGTIDAGATREMLATLRSANYDDASAKAVELLNKGVSPQSLWDAFQVCAGEQVLRQPAIVGLHAATTTNALAFAYRTTASDETRRLLMLQNASFLTMFRDAQGGRGGVRNVTVDELEPAANDASGDLDAVFSSIGGSGSTASVKTLGWLKRDGNPQQLIDAARVLVYLKSRDAHDYKFSSAILEDYAHISPQWRDVFLAANVNLLPGSTRGDSGLVERTRAALEG